MGRVMLGFILLGTIATLAFGDEVVLKNGNHLTGNIVKLDDDKLVLATDFADSINIKWGSVASFTADKPLVVKTGDNQQKVLGLAKKDDYIILTEAGGGTSTMPLASLNSLRSQDEQSAYEKTLSPGLLEGWDGGANLGLGLARGNSDTLNLSTGMNLARATLADKTSLYATSVYSKDNILDSITANAIQGGIRYDRNLTKKVFVYVSGDFEYNDLQKLDLRSILGVGLGWHALASPRTTLDIFGGLSWTHEKYGTGLTNNLFAPSVGEELSYKLSTNTVLKEKAFFFPYVSGGQAGEYRFAFDSGLSTKINKWLAWQTTLTDRYVSNPLPATKGNDLLLSTGIGLTVGGNK
jgi:hypothetical protein